MYNHKMVFCEMFVFSIRSSSIKVISHGLRFSVLFFLAFLTSSVQALYFLSEGLQDKLPSSNFQFQLTL